MITAGSDLKMILRLEGVFFERFELQAFPFDLQDLTVTLAIKCATNGKMPVDFANEKASCKVLTEHFAYSDVWQLDPMMATEVGVVGAASRQFPCVHMRAKVRRRPGFTLINVAFPSMVICGLPTVVFSIDEEITGDKLAINLTVLPGLSHTAPHSTRHLTSRIQSDAKRSHAQPSRVFSCCSPPSRSRWSLRSTCRRRDAHTIVGPRRCRRSARPLSSLLHCSACRRYRTSRWSTSTCW